MSIKHLQRLAAFLRHAIQPPPRLHAIRQLLLILLHFPQRIAIQVAFPPLAPRQRHAILPPRQLAIPVAKPVALHAILAVKPVAILAILAVAGNPVAALALLVAEPALRAVKKAATDIAADF